MRSAAEGYVNQRNAAVSEMNRCALLIDEDVAYCQVIVHIQCASGKRSTECGILWNLS